MQIEIYKVEETNDELSGIVADVNAIELIEKLGLSGQKTLVDNKKLTRVAFRRMTEVEREVYSLLFPEKTRVTEFNTEIIPVRVLEALNEATEQEQFCYFEVWHAATRKDDPILVGVQGKPDPQTWNKDYVNVTGHFIIARWGEALQPFKVLCQQAKQLWIARETRDKKNRIAELQQQLVVIQEDANIKFTTV
ncbi:MAG: hypothetical protein KGL39_08495 [Patescibacteria group bacterium]|nr:hypothetical protein [Patescibacteria group bacterium]